MRTSRRIRWCTAAALLALPAATQAAPLSVVEVSAPAINCVFHAGLPCTITVTDSIGNIGLFSVEQIHNIITFIFNQPVCPGPTPGTGASSFFFGLTSTHPPKAVAAKVSVPGLLPEDVKARAPAH